MPKGKRGNGNRKGGTRGPKPIGWRKPLVKRKTKPTQTPFQKFILSPNAFKKLKKERAKKQAEKNPIWERRIEQYAGKTVEWHQAKRKELLADIDRLFDQGNQTHALLTGIAKHNGSMSTRFIQLFRRFIICSIQHKQARQHFLANALHQYIAEHGRIKVAEKNRFNNEIKNEFIVEECYLHLIRDTNALVHEAKETFESLRKP